MPGTSHSAPEAVDLEHFWIALVTTTSLPLEPVLLRCRRFMSDSSLFRAHTLDMDDAHGDFCPHVYNSPTFGQRVKNTAL